MYFRSHIFIVIYDLNFNSKVEVLTDEVNVGVLSAVSLLSCMWFLQSYELSIYKLHVIKTAFV